PIDGIRKGAAGAAAAIILRERARSGGIVASARAVLAAGPLRDPARAAPQEQPAKPRRNWQWGQRVAEVKRTGVWPPTWDDDEQRWPMPEHLRARPEIVEARQQSRQAAMKLPIAGGLQSDAAENAGERLHSSAAERVGAAVRS